MDTIGLSNTNQETISIVSPTIPTLEELVENNVSIVNEALSLAYKKYPSSVDFNELRSVAFGGLLEAAEKYIENYFQRNEEKKSNFKGFAFVIITYRIKDSVRKNNNCSRRLRKSQFELEQATRELQVSLKREPTDDEIASRLGISQKRYINLKKRLSKIVILTSLDADLEFCLDNKSLSDFIGASDESLEQIRNENNINRYEILNKCLSALPPTHKQLLEEVYLKDKQAIELLGILANSRSRLSQLHIQALYALRNMYITECRKRGLTSYDLPSCSTLRTHCRHASIRGFTPPVLRLPKEQILSSSTDKVTPCIGSSNPTSLTKSVKRRTWRLSRVSA